MIARIAALITAGLGVVTGAFVLFGPTYTRCSLGPMPLLVLALWSLAPLLAVLGVWSGRPWLVAVALVVEMSSILARRSATAAGRTPV